jgi:RNA polymerase sigma factor (TIGR02999 family)
MPAVPSADPKTRNLTMLLDGLNGGDAGAFSRVVDEVYADLKRIANKRMADRFDQPPGALTMQATAIANDAVMELRRQRVQWQNSDQFFAIATRLIERLISGYRKQRNAQKRGAGQRGAPLEHAEAAVDTSGGADFATFEAVSEALAKLHEAYPRKAEVVTLHVLCGHPLSKVKEMVGVEQATVERDWAFAKKWLARELKEA